MSEAAGLQAETPLERVQPLSVLIGALGGEGGGVLTDWIVAAAMARGFPVQSTSIPGVAQRTGATTYYIELFPRPREALNGRSPVLALYPSPGRVDLAVMSELVEAGRAMETGMVSPERTVLIGSTHRIYAIAEKSAMADGRLDADTVRDAAPQMARRAVLFDMARTARDTGSVISAVMLGAIAGSGVLPLTAADFEQAIRDKGVAVEANLRGFQSGLAQAQAPADPTPAPAEPEVAPAEPLPELPIALAERVAALPEPVREVAARGAARLIGYQDARYAALYLERVEAVAALEGGGGDHELTRETARHLALWMSYEDAIRVAAEKTRRGRMAHVRAETGAAAHEPVHITEFLDPGVEEIAAVMPRPLGRALMGLTARSRRLARWRRPMQVRTDTVRGFLQLWLMARLRPIRRLTYRYADEQALIGRWLEAVAAAAPSDRALAVEIAGCARLIKGYGDTYHRGRGNFERIYRELIAPGLNGGAWPAADALRRAREAALADPAGKLLTEALGTPPDAATTPPTVN